MRIPSIVAADRPARALETTPVAMLAEWAEGEEAREREREALVGELSAAMLAHGHDPTPIREAMGG